MAHRSDTEQEPDNRIDDVVTYLGSRYEYILLPLIVAFMFYTRYLSRDNFSFEPLELAGVDSYYHWRTTMYSVEQWPNTMPFDVWTNFPSGQDVGHFGTAYDQLIATIALLVGLGDPSPELVHSVALVIAPLLGALVAIPVYFLGKRLGGRIAGISAAVLLALFPGSFFARSTTGQLDHHVAEVLFMAIAILAFVVAIHVADREKPVFEQLQDRDIDGLGTTFGYSALAGIALAAYMAMWPSGMLLIAIIGVFFVVYLSLEYASGRSPEHLAFVGAISMTVTGVLLLGLIEELSTGSTSYGYLAPLLSFGVAGGCIFMAALARRWDTTDYDRLLYPGAVAASIVVVLGILSILIPGLVSGMLDEFLRRMTPFGPQVTDLTIVEAQPPEDIGDRAFREFGLVFYTAIVALIGMILTPLLGGKGRPEHGLIVVWSLFLFSMAMTQVRFWYYLALPLAVLNAYLIGYVVEWADLERGLDSLRNVEGYQIMVLATVLMVLVVPLMPPVANATVLDIGENQGPHGDAGKWDESLSYLQGSTPAVGDWAGEGNDLEYYGAYERPDGSYDYPEGSYGVMSWWDYGHLITVNGERIPRANPFQTGATDASRYLLAESEERANLLLDAMSTNENLDQDTADLATAMEEYDEDDIDDFRYVMIDDAMATGKFQAITAWSGPDYNDFTTAEAVQLGEDTAQLQRMNERFYNTTVGSFYFGDGAGAEHYRMVHESSERSTIVSVAQEDESGAWQSVITNANLDALGQQALRAIQIQPELQLYDIREQAAVKTFERVEGATITGETDAAPGSTVTARLVLNTTDRSFTYGQEASVDDDGTFEVTVPYATNDERGPDDGYTESDVYAEDDYEISIQEDGNTTEEGSVAVPESAIYDGDSVTVDLEEAEDDEQNGGDDTNGEDNGTDEGNESVDDGNGTTDGNESTDDNDTVDNTTASLGVPIARP